MNGYVLERTEDAWIHYLASSSLSASITLYYRGTEYVTKEGSAIIVYCPSAEEVERGCGIYRTQAQIMLKYLYTDSSSLSTRNIVQTTFNDTVLGNDNLLNDLTGSTNRIHFWDATFGGQSNSFAGDAIITQLNIDMVVAQKAT